MYKELPKYEDYIPLAGDNEKTHSLVRMAFQMGIDVLKANLYKLGYRKIEGESERNGEDRIMTLKRINVDGRCDIDDYASGYENGAIKQLEADLKAHNAVIREIKTELEVMLKAFKERTIADIIPYLDVWQEFWQKYLGGE